MVFFSLAVIVTKSGCSNPTASNSGGDNTPVILKGDGVPGNSTWTIMVYLDGDNNLEEAALTDMNEMELVNLDGEGVKVIVLIDRCNGYTTADGDWKGTRLYEIEADNDLNAIKSTRLTADASYFSSALTGTGDNEELNMGNPATVTAFIDYCQVNYSADHYAFIFRNHGGGWRDKLIKKGGDFKFTPRYLGSSKEKIPKEPINKAVCWDETSINDCLYMSEVGLAVAGKGITLIGFDACLMGMVEVAYQLLGETDYVVASEETEPVGGWAYQYFLYDLIMQSDNSPANLGKAIVDSYIDHTPYSGITLSVIDMANMANLVTAIDNFATNLISASADETCKARYDTQCFYVPHYIDLYNFAENLPAITGSSELRTAIDNAISYHRHKDFPDSHGLSIYYPVTALVDSEYASYNGTVIAFPGASTWDELLTDYYADATYYTIETFANGGGDNADTYLVLFTENSNYIYEDDDSGSSLYSKLILPLASGDTYYILNIDVQPYPGYYSILANIGGGGGPSPETPDQDAYEPNNTTADATLLPYDTVQDHYLSLYEQDWLQVTIPIP